MNKPKYQIGDIVFFNNNNYLIEDITYWDGNDSVGSMISSYCMRRLEDNYTCIRYHAQVDSRFIKVA